MMVISADGTLLEYNNQAREMLGYTDKGMKQLTIYDWEKGVSENDIAKTLKSFIDFGRVEFSTVYINKHKNEMKVDVIVNKIQYDDIEALYLSIRPVRGFH